MHKETHVKDVMKTEKNAKAENKIKSGAKKKGKRQ